MNAPHSMAPPVAATTDAGAFPLRDYQLDALDSVDKAFANGRHRVAVVIPTGGGKTVVFANLIDRAHTGARVLVLAHRTELIDQAADKIRAICPGRSIGIVRNVENDHQADVVVASIQTIHRRLAGIKPFDLIIIDEAHHATAATYRKVLDAFPDARAVGVSATLVRSDKDCLGDVWEEVAYRVDILDLIDHQPPYLCDVRGIRVITEGLDLSNVKTGSNGDFRLGELEQEMGEAGAWQATVAAYLKHARDRIGVVFTPTMKSAHIVAELFVANGIPAEAVDSETDKDERKAILARFATGETQVVANCGVLTEGFDNTSISCVTIARPTKSAGLYVQMAGRGLRLHPGKEDCLILDVVGTTDGKKLASLADLTGHDVDEVADGESLKEAKERSDSAVRNVTTAPYLGDLTDHEINLFGESKVTWSTWNGDVRYIDVPIPSKSGSATAYIAPSATVPGRFDAVARWRPNSAEKVLAEGVALPSAMRKTEAFATEHGGGLVVKHWTSKPASDGQRKYARRLGISIPADATTRTASDLIDAAKVRPEIDRDFIQHAPRGYNTSKAA